MSSGSSKRFSSRILPPIKNPLFNPNERADNVQIPSVRSSPNKGRPSRLNGLTNFFTNRSRNRTSESPDSSSSNRIQNENSPSLSPANSRRGSATDRENSLRISKNLPSISRDSSAKKKGNFLERKTKSVVMSNRFARNLTTSSDDDAEDMNTNFSCERTGVDVFEKADQEIEKKPLLLRREKEKPCSLLEGRGNSDINGLSVSDSTRNCSASQSINHLPGQRGTSSVSLGRTKDIEQVRYQDALSLRNDWRAAKVSGDYGVVVAFLTHTFDSFHEMSTVFKKREDSFNAEDQHESGIDYDFVRITFDIVLTLPQELQKTVLKSIINSLLQDLKRQRSKDDLRAYMILLQNPQFNNAATYVIFAHLLRQVSSLIDGEHQFLVQWLRCVPLNTFKATIARVNQFISIRMFPCKANELPPEEKCRWWIPSAVKVLALLNAANWLSSPPLVSHVFFYNQSVDNIDLMGEYYSWQNPVKNQGKFSFCQYPFILSLGAKRYIMQKDSESQMIVMARKSLVEKVQRRQMPDMGMLFLNIKVRRSHLISDSLNEVSRKQRDLKKKLKVTFAGEPGLDMGGLTKEWFLLLIRKIFRPEYGMFTYNEKSRYFWFRNTCVDNDSEFNLVGVLMGLAVYNSIILDIHFPPCCYKKLLSPAVVPYQNPNASVGVANLGLEDLRESMPDLAHGLKELLDYGGNVEEDLCQTFQMSYHQFGEVVTHNLKPNGDRIPVTNENRNEYVALYVDFLLNKSIYQQFASFYHGFHSVCASNALIMLRPEEVEMLVCGNPELDMEALRKVTVYEGYSKSNGTIRYFWEVVMAFSTELKKKLLLFATGSDRVPIGGMGEMEFKIMKMEVAHSTNMLPMAHTCFNQLCLPPYKSRRTLKHKLTIAISNAEGFGIE